MQASGVTRVFQRLLLATEHSEFDVGAERVAMALAQRCNQPLAVVMPIVGNAEYEAVAPQLAARADADAAAKLRELQVAAQAAGVAIATRVRHGAEPDREIVDEAREQGVDLIVVRRRGRRGFLANLLVGEMVGQVLSRAPCSVLLVPRASALWSQRVLAALDPQASPAARENLLGVAIAVAVEYVLPIGFVCVAEGDGQGQRLDADQALAHALATARSHGLAADGEVRSGKAFQQIVSAAGAGGADLIVVGRNGGRAAGRARLGGTAQKVIGQAHLPVLVVVSKGPPT